MKYNVCVLTGTRADYGLLRNLLFRLKTHNKIKLSLLVTGSHLSDKFGNTQDEIIKDGFEDYVKVPIPIDDDSRNGMANATGYAVMKFAEYFSEHKTDIIVILGDRYEALAAAISASFCGIPIAHISGGDVTEGAIDDAIRHCITKLSSLHFPGCNQSANRIIQMGEQPQNVFNVGEPGVENCLNCDLMHRKNLSESIAFDIENNDYAVVTFHPVTMEDNTGVKQVCELIEAMDTFSHISYIITLANADAGGRAINDLWIKEGQKRENWLVVPSLGVVRYLSALKYAKFVLGNSSSGIVEAPSMKIATVNIGDRQKGRMVADSIVCCEPIKENIVESIKEVLSEEFQKKVSSVISPFGDGNTSFQIVEKIINFMEKKTENFQKHFYDIEF